MWQVTSRLKEEVVKQTFTFITFLWVRLLVWLSWPFCLWLLTRLMVKRLLNHSWGIVHAQVHSRVFGKISSYGFLIWGALEAESLFIPGPWPVAALSYLPLVHLHGAADHMAADFIRMNKWEAHTLSSGWKLLFSCNLVSFHYLWPYSVC